MYTDYMDHVLPENEGKSKMMKKAILCMLCILLLLVGSGSAENTVQLPDQYLSCRVYGGCQVQRYPNTEIVSITEDISQGIFSTYIGALSFDYPGDYTVYLVEYDTDTDTTYKTTVHVKVSPIEPTVEWKWDHSGNSAQTRQWMTQKGNIFAVGQQVSFKHTCRINGVEQKIVYSSNNPAVATVDANGLVTMHNPGRASILYRAEGTDVAQENWVIVHDGEAWVNTWGEFWPEDSNEKLCIYKQPDMGSTVIAVKSKLDTDNFYVISRGEGWSKVCYNGKVGYVQTGKLIFGDGFEGKTPEEETVPDMGSSSEGEMEQKSDIPGAEASQNDAEERNQSSVMWNSGIDTVFGLNQLDAVPEPECAVMYQVDGNAQIVKVKQLGVCESEIYSSDTNTVISIPTAELSWETNVLSAKRLASVKAPKNGSASLRREGTTRSEVITKVTTGTLLPVVEYGKEFSKVVYGTYTGYIMNDALDFYSGNEKGREAVIISPNTRLHSGAGADYSTIGYLSYGAKVIVLKTRGNWAMVNVDGYVGYVAKKYIR